MADITVEELEAAYELAIRGTLEPDVIYFGADECPRCGHPWSRDVRWFYRGAVSPSCARCNWPES